VAHVSIDNIQVPEGQAWFVITIVYRYNNNHTFFKGLDFHARLEFFLFKRQGQSQWKMYDLRLQRYHTRARVRTHIHTQYIVSLAYSFQA